jgi:hypothetical protein
MNKLRLTKLLTLTIALGLVVSCSSPSKLYPYHTTVQGIYGLEAGMDMKTVESTLGSVKPFDLKANFDDGYKVIEYKYMHLFQKVPIKKRNNPEYVSGGKEAFKDESSLYVVFDNQDKMLFYVTDAGKKRAESSLATANDLNMIKLYPELFASKVKPVKKSPVIGKKSKPGFLSKLLNK